MESEYYLRQGKKLASLIEEGKLKDFYVYICDNCNSRLTTTNENVGRAFVMYIQTISDEEAEKLVDMAFNIKNWNKIDALRIAKHIAVNFNRYKDKSTVKAYLNLHKPSINTFNSAMVIASKSSISKVVKKY